MKNPQAAKDSKSKAEVKSQTKEEPNRQGTEAPVVDSGSSTDNRKVSREDIELVQNLIERCLQLYMNKAEVVKTLLHRARIEPGFTTLDSHTAEYIASLVDKSIEEVGPDNVVQVVTDNASANMAAGRILRAKYPRIFWSSCAAHCIDLMLEEIGKESKVKTAITKARTLTVFIYNHAKTLSLMRQFTQKGEIVRPGTTRFATTYLTLQSVMEKKDKLRLMFSSDEWRACKWYKTKKGEMASAIVLSPSFWTQVSLTLKVFSPLVHVLRIVDGDRRPAMGFVYGELQDARKEIMGIFKDVEASYKHFVDAIDSKAKGRLDSPLHLAAYYLNPYFFYRDIAQIQREGLALKGFLDCMDIFYPDLEIQDIITRKELPLYEGAEGSFGKPLAIRQRSIIDDDFNPVWQKLEEENSEFFRAYYIRLKLKKQIILFNHLLEHQYNLMKYPMPHKIPMAPIQNGIHPMPVNNLPIGYPVMPQHPMAAPGQPHLDSMSCGLSSCHVVNGVPAPGNFQPIRINTGNDSRMNNSTAEVAPLAPCSAMSSVSEMAVSPASVASSGHFPFSPPEISGMGVDTSALDTAFTSDVASSAGLQLGMDGAGSSKDSLRTLGHIPWTFSLSDLTADLTNLEDLGALGNYTGSPFLGSESDILLGSPEQDDMVENYFVDNVMGTHSQSDEEKT